jgi:hypothetical protein
MDKRPVMPAEEAVSQFQSSLLQVYVIPGLTRNPVVFRCYNTGCRIESGMTGKSGMLYGIMTKSPPPA